MWVLVVFQPSEDSEQHTVNMEFISSVKLPYDANDSSGGFSFDNCRRNDMIAGLGNVKMPKAHKTGTTIVGVVYKVTLKLFILSIHALKICFCRMALSSVLIREPHQIWYCFYCAQFHAYTFGKVVDKNCEKIHYIAPNIYCCGAGTAADTEMTW